VLVLVVRGLVAGLALSGTGWGWDNTWTWLVLLALNVVSTWGQSVWSASILISEQVTGNETSVDVVVPSRSWVSTIATETARSTTGHKILGGDSGLDGLVRSDANSVRHSFGGTESPAGSTVSLISNFVQRLAFWPLGSSIEAIWGSDGSVEFRNVWKAGLGFEVGTHQVLNLSLGHLLESGWFNSSPGSVHGVDLLSDVGDSVGVRALLGSALVNSKSCNSEKNND
jgi:hypothetical protein